MKVVEKNFKGDPETARQLRELADEAEKGNVANIVVVWDNRIERYVSAYGDWDDRWRLLGSLEYAKLKILEEQLG